VTTFRNYLALVGIFLAVTAGASIHIPASKVSLFVSAADLGSSAAGAGGTLGLSGQMAYGGGLTYGFGLGSHLEGEIGVIGTVHSPSGTPTYFVEWPLLIRVPLGNVFSIGAGAYALDTVDTGWGGGAEGSLRLSLPMGAKVSLLIEGRYRYGLVAVSPSGSQFHDVAFTTMLGVTIKL